MDKQRVQLPEKAFERGRELMKNRNKGKTNGDGQGVFDESEEEKSTGEKIERVKDIYASIKKREKKLRTKLKKIKKLKVKLRSYLQQHRNA